LPPELRSTFETSGQGMGATLCGGLCGGIFGGLAGFYLSHGLTYVLAKLLGGTGSYTTQTYLASLFAVPLGILSGFISLIPCLGLLAALGFIIFGFVLTVRMLKVTHALPTGKALIVMGVPILLSFIILGCLVFGMIALMIPILSNSSMFESIFSILPGIFPA